MLTTTVDPTTICTHCHKPIGLDGAGYWIATDGTATDQRGQRVRPQRDVFDIPDHLLGGLSYREATKMDGGSIIGAVTWSWMHTPVATFWYEPWGPAPEYILQNRELVERALTAAGDATRP